MTDRNVILVEDILDTGLTLNYIQKLLLAHQPRTLRIAALLDKPRGASSRSMRTISDSPSRMPTWSGMDWTMPSAIVTCQIFA